MAPEALTWVLGDGTGQGLVRRATGGAGARGRQGRKDGKGGGPGGVVLGGGPGVVGEGVGPRGAGLSLPHVSFDVIQAEGHTLVRAAPFGLLLALAAAAQFVFNDLRGRWAGGRVAARLEPRPSSGSAWAPRPH